MKNSLQQHFAIAIHLLVFVVVICIAVFVSYSDKQEIEKSLTERIVAQEKRIYELAETTDRNGADADTSLIISDCPRRADYEGYLVRLATLSKQELVVMQNLFESCSPFYIQQKALMVSKLDREIESHTEYVSLLSTLHDVSNYEARQEQFKMLAEVERQKSGLMTDQTDIQSKIISLLISGKSAQGSEVAVLLKEAQSIGELLSVYDHRVDDIRAKIKQ